MSTPKLTAKLVPYSSGVGQSVALHDEAGAVVALVMISVPSPSRDYRSTAEPIANLIAAAPEMLEALKLVERDRLNCNGRVLELHAPIIRAAVAKAEGRS